MGNEKEEYKESIEEDRREYFRINISLPFEYYPVSSEKEDSLNTNMFIHDNAGPKESDVFIMLKSIHAKLDHIIRCLHDGSSPTRIPPIRKINISAGGVRFKCGAEFKFKVGDILHITVGLPPCPYTILSLLGEIVRATRSSTGYEIALQLLNIGDDQRRDIIRCLFDVQREMISEKTSS